MTGVASAALAVGIVVLVARWLVVRRGTPHVVDVGALSGPFAVAAVLGAGVLADGTPTPLLARRIDAAVDLYRIGAVKRLLMSGAAVDQFDQPAAMARYARLLGVPGDAIDLDRTGVDTAATCRTLVAQYGAEPVLLVTQAFHAPRTAYLARKAGLDAKVLATSDLDVRARSLSRARLRERPAAVKAMVVDRF